MMTASPAPAAMPSDEDVARVIARRVDEERFADAPAFQSAARAILALFAPILAEKERERAFAQGWFEGVAKENQALIEKNEASEARALAAEAALAAAIEALQPFADEKNGIAFVFLRDGFEAIIDLADLPLVEGKAWRLLTTPTGHAYAYTRVPGNAMFLMHRMLMNSLPGEMVDHVDGDGINNRRSNLRNCSAAQNQANRAAERRSRLGIKGVSPRKGRFKATITPKGKKIHLGYYATAEEAAAAYRGAARLLWGDFAYAQGKKKGPASRS